MSALPTIEQVREIPAVLTLTADPEYLDVNGHVANFRYSYFGGRGAKEMLVVLGVNRRYQERRGFGLVSAEAHQRFLSEVRAHERVSLHPLVVARSRSVAHLMVLMVDDSRDRLSCIYESLVVHFDLSQRRPCPLPEDIAAGFDSWIERTAQLSWHPPISGPIGVRHAVRSAV